MNSANERICMHACLVAQRGSYIEQTVHNCPDCQCLKSAINSDCIPGLWPPGHEKEFI